MVRILVRISIQKVQKWKQRLKRNVEVREIDDRKRINHGEGRFERGLDELMSSKMKSVA